MACLLLIIIFVSLLLAGAFSTTTFNVTLFSFLSCLSNRLFISFLSFQLIWKLCGLILAGYSKTNPFVFRTVNAFLCSSSIPTELREDGFQPQTYLVQGVKALHTALKLWMKKEVSSCFW